MSERPDLLAAQFAPLVNTTDDSDWTDVLHRSRRRTRRTLVLPLAAALAVLVAGSALALQRELVDFFASEPAPEHVVRDFRQLEARARAMHWGGDIRPLAGETRKVMEAEIRGKRRSLYVAPTNRGGFCWEWEEVTGSCARHGRRPGKVGVTPGWGPDGGVLVGNLLDSKTARVELRFEDESKVELPFVWVSPPIDAGFFVYEYGRERLRPGRRPAAVVALDADGDEIARREVRYPEPPWGEMAPDGLPLDADRTRKRTLFAVRDHRGRRWTLVTAPMPDGRVCFSTNMSRGCLTHEQFARRDMIGIQPGGESVNVCCQAGAGVAAVELRYEGGERELLRPVDGWLLHVIDPRYYRPGRRLSEIVARDAQGRELARNPVPTERAGIYPCEKGEEVDFGAGFELCP